MNWSYHSISKTVQILLSLCIVVELNSCTTGATTVNTPTEELSRGTISYPFVDEATALAQDPGRSQDDRFVIRSANGQGEIAIEIPGGAVNYDVEVPLMEAYNDPKKKGPQALRPGVSPVTTDQELLRTLPKFPNLSAEQDAQAALLNPRNPDAGPSQAPSYSLGLARIGDFFKARQFEYALIEINQMLAFYPNSPRLLKMKGTVLIKMQQFNLAAVAWEKARSLTPNDRALKRALDRLQYRLQNDTAH